MSTSPAGLRHQGLIGAATLVLGALIGAGAVSIPSTAGYAGVGPNFLPWLVAVVLMLCGGLLLWEARSGGFRELEAPSAGVLANAALITSIGFILSCSLCFVLAVRGLRGSEGRPAGGLRQTVVDAVTGLLIAAPVFWMFTKVLAINLPGLTGTGWL
jgi:putative tricarboxylic transport membrane protein